MIQLIPGYFTPCNSSRSIRTRFIIIIFMQNTFFPGVNAAFKYKFLKNYNGLALAHISYYFYDQINLKDEDYIFNGVFFLAVIRRSISTGTDKT